MKRLLFIIFTLLVIFSCSSDNDAVNTELTGTWKLTEVNNDPGDGSGKFIKIKTDKVLVFKTDKTITSNGSLCQNYIESDSPSSGTYELNKDSNFSGIIKSSECEYEMVISIRFEIKGSTLYVYYPCIEGCAAKYKKE